MNHSTRQKHQDSMIGWSKKFSYHTEASHTHALPPSSLMWVVFSFFYLFSYAAAVHHHSLRTSVFPFNFHNTYCRKNKAVVLIWHWNIGLSSEWNHNDTDTRHDALDARSTSRPWPSVHGTRECRACGAGDATQLGREALWCTKFISKL